MNRLNGRAATLDPLHRQVLKQRPEPVFFCLRREGAKVYEFWLARADQLAAIEAAVERVHVEVPASELARLTSIEVTLSHSSRSVDTSRNDAWNSINRNAARGVLGVEFDYEGVRERVSPISMISANRSVEQWLQRFVARHEIPIDQVRERVKVHQFNADQLLLTLREPRAVERLVRGAPLVSPAEVTAEKARKLLAHLGGFLVNSVRPDGRMLYMYLPSRGEEILSQNNMIRQWMATLALIRLVNAGAGKAARTAASRNLAYNHAHHYRQDGEFGLIEHRGHVKLGAVALAVLAIVESPERSSYADAERRLWRTIERQWRPSGEFRTFYEPESRNDQQDYYPGEALLAWAARLREERDTQLLARFMRSFEYYKNWHLSPEHRNPAFVPWHTQAYYTVFRQTRERSLADFIFEMNDWLLSMQQWPMTEHPEAAGRFYDPHRPFFGPPHASSTGVYLEGLVDAYRLAADLDDEVRKERYRVAICRGIRSVMQLTFRDDRDMYYVSKRAMLRGGVRTNCYNNAVRIDNVQHTFMALQKIVENFTEVDYSCTDRATSAAIEKDKPSLCGRVRILYGANFFFSSTACAVQLSIRPEFAVPDDLSRQLGSWLPEGVATSLPETASASTPGLAAAEALAHLAAGLLRHASGSTPLAKAVASSTGEYQAAVTSEYPELGARALELSARLIDRACSASGRSDFPELNTAVENFFAHARSVLPSWVRGEITRVARSRGIPWERVSRKPDVFRLGVGCHQQMCDLTTTSRTSRVHAQLTSNKPIANRVFRGLGVPMARQQVVTSAEQAVNAAHALGFPVVTKPWRGSGGRGVSANLKTPAEVRVGYTRAMKLFGKQVAVEEYLPGDDYRFFLIQGELVAAAKRIAPQVVGDGRHSVAELIDIGNRNRDRGDGLTRSLAALQVDEETLRMLAAAGYGLESKPRDGEVVRLRSAANGGTTEDVTSSVHPDNVRAAERAARIAGLDVCGVDFLLPDPTRSYRETGGGICEVNYQPSLQLHVIADNATTTTVVERLVASLIPPGTNGRIPVAVLFGASPSVAPLADRLLGKRGVARVDSRAVQVAGFDVTRQRGPWADACRMALCDPLVRVALLEPSAREVLEEGLSIEWCNALVFANPDAAIGPAERSLSSLADTLVAWNEMTAAKGLELHGRHLLLCGRQSDCPQLNQHCDRGGSAVWCSSGELHARWRGGAPRDLGPLGRFDAQPADIVLAVATALTLSDDPGEFLGSLEQARAEQP